MQIGVTCDQYNVQIGVTCDQYNVQISVTCDQYNVQISVTLNLDEYLKKQKSLWAAYLQTLRYLYGAADCYRPFYQQQEVTSKAFGIRRVAGDQILDVGTELTEL